MFRWQCHRSAPVWAQANLATDSATCRTSMELMEEVVCRENLLTAWVRVKRNRGAAGIDDMSVEDLMPYCREHWPCIKKLLLSGHYRAQAVKQVVIPKGVGGGGGYATSYPILNISRTYTAFATQ